MNSKIASFLILSYKPDAYSLITHSQVIEIWIHGLKKLIAEKKFC